METKTLSQAMISSIEHTIFLDWDDTLMPSTYLLSNIHYDRTEKDKTFSIKEERDGFELKQFISNLEITGNAAFELLTKICSKFKSKNIKIITNGVKGWLYDSLFIAGSFCKIYNKIKNILSEHQIEVIYARNYKLEHIHWKTTVFNKLLWQYFHTDNSSENKDKNSKLNVITIGDQWTDHESVPLSFTYSIYGDLISHHQIKLYDEPDCKYLGIELKYISDIFDEQILFGFNNIHNIKSQHKHGLVLEFDGYHNDN